MATLFDPLSQALLMQSASPEARQAQQLDELFRTINAESAGAQNAKPLSMPFPGMAVRDAPAPAASQQPRTQAPSIDSRFLEASPMPTSSKRQDRLAPVEGNFPQARTTVQPKTSYGAGPAGSAGSSAGPQMSSSAPQRVEADPDFSPTFAERLTNFGNALTSQGTVTNFAEQQRQRNATYKALRGMGVDDTMARAAVMNPDFLQTILKSRVGTPQLRQIDTETEVVLWDDAQGREVQRFKKNIGEAELQRKTAQEQAKQAVKQPAEFSMGKQKLRTMDTSFKTVEGDIIEALKMVKNQGLIPETGTIGKARSYLPFQYDARTLDGLLTTIKSNIGFDKLQAMRDASPTGGALGQVSEFENRLLQATSGALEQGDKDAFLVRNLERILENWRGLNKAYHNEFAQTFNIPPEAQLAPSGDYVIPDPDNPGRYLRWTPDSGGEAQ